MAAPKKKPSKNVGDVIAQSLKTQGVEYVFGIVGYPIIELGFQLQHYGIKYVGMRNEQAASYAAAAVGYLTGRPGCCLVVPGPGVIHALAGMANASANGWPMLVIAGSSELSQDGLGAFQESLPPQGGAQIQATYASQVGKYAIKATDASRVPYFIEQAIRYAVMGRPGATYVEIGGDTLRHRVDLDDIHFPAMVSNPVLQPAPAGDVKRALEVLAAAKSPLIITGKGAAYAEASPEINEFVARTGIPFLPTPMGKGVVDDEHELCVSSARAAALKGADVILLVGARLNWILHYGRPPRYGRGVKIIQVEILPEEIGHSVPPEVPLVGHAKAISSQLLDGLKETPVRCSKDSEWVVSLRQAGAKSADLFAQLAMDRSAPMNYYCALGIINKYLPKDVVIVNEGSDTMDIGRTVLMNSLPRKRLDAGTWGTMGVGMGQAIAGALVHPNPGVVAVLGDSAFGFSGMEMEVVCRMELPIIVVIINNNGIGAMNPTDWMGLSGTTDRFKYPAKSLTPACRYDVMASGFGAKGVLVETADALEEAIRAATSIKPFRPTLINAIISVSASRGKASPPPFAKVGKL